MPYKTGTPKKEDLIIFKRRNNSQLYETSISKLPLESGNASNNNPTNKYAKFTIVDEDLNVEGDFNGLEITDIRENANTKAVNITFNSLSGGYVHLMVTSPSISYTASITSANDIVSILIGLDKIAETAPATRQGIKVTVEVFE